MPNNDIGDNVQRHGRSRRGSSLTRPGIPPAVEKLETLTMTKPLPGSEKNRSKSGRPPSKKLKDRKALIRVGPIVNSNSLNYTGLACSGPFWNKMEAIFASVSSEDLSYLKQQLSFAEELDENMPQMFGIAYNNVSGVGELKEVNEFSGGRQRSQSHQESAETDSLNGRFDTRKSDKFTPLYQRVLSALIEEDEIEEFYHHGEGKTLSLQYASDDSHRGSCYQIDIEPKDWDKMESEVESKVDSQTQSNYLDRLSCDSSIRSNSQRNPTVSSSLHSNERWWGDYEFAHFDLGPTSEICLDNLGQLQAGELSAGNLSPYTCHYQLLSLDDRLLLELQSIGLYPEILPNLAEGEVINQDIMELNEGLYQQASRRNYVSKNAVQKVSNKLH
ncbi:hypothetical protein CIPAW_13G136500 [Carya illinoinensis]|uniref:Uncharacterized protein n=1 Tax=Carya illinoinensis TaxID=32201 RepID=A0A8T1NKH7_CARIL|nr:hypothetical protein CIPAW_13G136500 [Carya illinoinensis]